LRGTAGLQSDAQSFAWQVDCVKMRRPNRRGASLSLRCRAAVVL